MFPDYMRTWMQLMYPELDLKTYVMGRSGSSLAGWYGGTPPMDSSGESLYERYAVPFNPDVIFMALGANGGQTVNEHINTYEKLFNEWVRNPNLYGNKSDRKLVMMGMKPQSGNKSEKAKGEFQSLLATQYDGLFSANNYPYWGDDYLANGKNGIPANQNGIDFQIQGADPFDGDGADHPGPPMHIVYAWAILKSLGVETLVSEATINAQTATEISSQKSTLSNITGNVNGVTFQRIDESLPWVVDEQGLDNAYRFRPEIENWQQYILTVKNLNPGNYIIKVDDEVIANVTSQQLNDGFNMASLRSGPVWRQSHSVLDALRVLNGFDPVNGNTLSGSANFGTYGDYLDHSLGNYQQRGLRGMEYVNSMLGTTPGNLGGNRVAYMDTLMNAVHTKAQPITRTYQISTTTTPPPNNGGSDTVAPSTPTNLASIILSSSQIRISWNPSSDAVGVVGYRVYVNGTQVSQSSQTTHTFSGLTSNTSYTLGVKAYDAAGNESSIATVTAATSASQSDTTQPTTSVTNPTSNQKVSGSNVTFSANASDIGGISNVKFILDGTNVIGTDTTSPYSVNFNSTTVADGNHSIVSVATDSSGNIATSTLTTFIIENSPVVNTAPANMPTGIPDPGYWGSVHPINSVAPSKPAEWPNNDVTNYYYIDITSPNATDSIIAGDLIDGTGRRYGYPNVPRRTIPEITYAAGAYVEVHGGPYTWDSGDKELDLNFQNCTANAVCWFRGENGNNKPDIAGSIELKGSYVILENLKIINEARLRVGGDASVNGSPLAQADHITVRNSDFIGLGTYRPGNGALINIRGESGSIVSDIVLHKNVIKNSDNVEYARTVAEDDNHGILPGQYINRVWILDSFIHDNAGDGIQISGNNSYGQARSNNVYIGRNSIYNNGENAIDIKSGTNIIISENNMYQYKDSAGSDGTAIVIQQEGGDGSENVWTLFNEVHDSTVALRVEETSAPIYAIGNVFHSLNGTQHAVYSRTRGAKLTLVDNTISGFPTNGLAWDGQGSTAPTINLHGNIFTGKSGTGAYWIAGDSTTNSGTSNYNLYDSENPFLVKWNGGIYTTLAAFRTGRSQDTNSVFAAPQFVGVSTALSAGSPAINANVEHSVYQTFEDLYGLNIRKDFNGNPRPQGGAWDIGAFEYSSGQSSDTTKPSVSLTSPTANQTLSNTVTLSANATDNVGISRVTFYVDNTQIGTYDISAPYSVSWNTTSVSNGSHTLTAVARDTSGNQTTSPPVTVTVSNTVVSDTDTDGDGIPNSADLCPFTPLNLKSYVNLKGCPKPLASNFDIKPDFTNTDLAANISNFEIGKTNYGKIAYQQAITLYTDSTITTQLNLDTLIAISQNKITIDSANASQLNRPATLTMYNVTVANPVIKKDGKTCNTCTIVSYTNRTLVFTVPGFSTYEVFEQGVASTPIQPIVIEQSGLIVLSPDIVYVTTASSVSLQIACSVGDTIKLYNLLSLLATKTCTTSPENISVSVPPVDGAMSITATISDATHTESAQSDPITVFNDPTSRSAPGTPDLVESSDL